ncbi:unnamed protein product [Cyclocybe aegerita]|uniref:DnaJ homologue subfamily C member 28 conserved domain-containing protein n=1 Tax=Cyclocybe aegerita TaxID=1973307 RepID=A0A8S0VQA9_CYCAE|nr:unnamed protein product [Cyclocybe aegerita]
MKHTVPSDSASASTPEAPPIDSPTANANTTQSASEQLFAHAALSEKEEAEALARQAAILASTGGVHENWTGEERMQDAVLRMLVDKYKPFRTGRVMSAEEKMKMRGGVPSIGSNQVPDDIRMQEPVWTPPLAPTTGSWATEPLLPSTEGHEPWHTTFKAPSHVASSVKLAQMPAQPSLPSSKARGISSIDDPQVRRVEKEERKRKKTVGRLTEAREATLDYRMGVGFGAKGKVGGGVGTGRSPGGGARPNPVSVKGWTSLVEERIEQARQAGLFKTVKGRGQPIMRTTEEYNPFIAREEFLMNRIVQRNGAVPPWVEIQSQLESAASSFREILAQSWTRRAVRMIVLAYPPPILPTLTLDDIKRHRDTEWAQKERAYHERAVEELNGLMRKYNGMAPYAVRRSYYIREVELEKVYKECAEGILVALRDRSGAVSEGVGAGIGGDGGGGGGVGVGDSSGGAAGTNPQLSPAGGGDSLVAWLRAIFRRLFGIRT